MTLPEALEGIDYLVLGLVTLAALPVSQQP